jgi:hypothetical protein
MEKYDDPSTTVDERKLEDDDSGGGSGGVGRGTVIIAALIALALAWPMAIGFALAFAAGWSLYRYARWRRSMVASVVVPLALITGLIVMSTASRFPGAFAVAIAGARFDWSAMFGVIVGLTMGLMAPMLAAGAFLGLVGSLVAVFVSVASMRAYPYKVVVRGQSWQYHFRFRKTLLETIRARRLLRDLKAGKYVAYGDPSLNPLGIEEEPIGYQPDPVAIHADRVVTRTEDEAITHTTVTGGTGSGKSTTLKELVLHDMNVGKTVFFIDCKNDPHMACSLAHMARTHGYEFYHFSVSDDYRVRDNPLGPATYDPLAHGGVSIKANMMLGVREWDSSSAVYRENAEAYLTKLFRIIDTSISLGILDRIDAIDTSQGYFSIFTQMLDPVIFNAVIVEMNNDERAKDIRTMASEINALVSPSNRSRQADNTKHAQTEYKNTMSGLMSSEYGRWLKRGGSVNGRNIDVFKIASKPKQLVLFSLEASNPGDRGTSIGSMICNDLTNMTASRELAGQTNPIGIYIDEFQSLPPTCVTSMVNKARSANAAIVLAFQSMSQLTASTGSDAYITALINTCSNFLFHAGSDYDVGLTAAKIIGTHPVPKYSIQKHNDSAPFSRNFTNNRNPNVSQTEDQEWILDPSEFTNLSAPLPSKGRFKSEAILIRKKSGDPIDAKATGPTAHKVSVIAPSEAFTEYYDATMPPMDIDTPVAGARAATPSSPAVAGESHQSPTTGGDAHEPSAPVSAVNEPKPIAARRRAEPSPMTAGPSPRPVVEPTSAAPQTTVPGDRERPGDGAAGTARVATRRRRFHQHADAPLAPPVIPEPIERELTPASASPAPKPVAKPLKAPAPTPVDDVKPARRRPMLDDDVFSFDE